MYNNYALLCCCTSALYRFRHTVSIPITRVGCCGGAFFLYLEGNKGAVLFNLASSSSRNYTITRARVTNKTQATPPITLVQEGENAGTSFGILVMKGFDFAAGHRWHPSQATQDKQGLISGRAAAGGGGLCPLSYPRAV